MRFLEYNMLNKNVISTGRKNPGNTFLMLSEDRKNLVNILRKECSEYISVLKRSGGSFLFRGEKRKVDEYEKVIPRINRTPKDTPLYVHLMLDKYFQKEFGWKARSEGVFATSIFHTADYYGTLYWFFPVNGYKFIWSDTISDLYWFLDNEEILEMRSVEIEDYIKNQLVYLYQDNDLQEALEDGHEVMFKCSAYYLINEDVGQELYDKLRS